MKCWRALLVEPEVEHLDDVGVHEPGRRQRLAAESGDERRVVGEVLGEQLDRDVALEALVERELDGRHPADAEAALDPIPPHDRCSVSHPPPPFPPLLLLPGPAPPVVPVPVPVPVVVPPPRPTPPDVVVLEEVPVSVGVVAVVGVVEVVVVLVEVLDEDVVVEEEVDGVELDEDVVVGVDAVDAAC